MKALWFKFLGRILCLVGEHDPGAVKEKEIPFYMLRCKRCNKIFVV